MLNDITFLKIIEAAKERAGTGLDRLFVEFYDELHKLAQQELRRGAPVTLSPTTLLHETFLNIAQRRSLEFENRKQFIVYAARAMRGVRVDYVRHRKTQKRGAQLEITSLPTELPDELQEDPDSIDIVKLNDAMESLAQVDPRLAECVDLRFFCGFSFNEIAQLREVSERTVQRDWDKARLLLSKLMQDTEGDLSR